jgi:hypothetical protein
MSPQQFFTPELGVVHFHTANLMDNSGQPHADFTPLPSAARRGPSGRTLLKTWMGTRGAVTPLHLDASHNLYAQLHGEKTFVLYPPTATHEALHLHPSLHPLVHMQMPRPASDDELARGLIYPPYEAHGTPEAQFAHLAEGDVLYIPPYWGHYARCERQCVAANLWWGSFGAIAEDAIQTLPLPFEAHWDTSRREASGLLFLRLLLRYYSADASHLPKAMEGVVVRLLNARWRHAHLLVGEATRGSGDDNSLQELPPCEPNPSEMPPPLRAKFEQYAAERASTLTQGMLADAVREIVLHDEVERIAHWVGSGNATRTHALLTALQRCSSLAWGSALGSARGGANAESSRDRQEL